MSSSLGSNLSELDRLLLELNAVQHSTPSFATMEDPAAPAPSCGTSHFAVQENGGSAGEKAAPPGKEKPKRTGGRGIEDVRPSVESLLDELESSVPTPTPVRMLAHHEVEEERDTPTRISASSATRELDELMASLSDFKPSSLGSLNSEAFHNHLALLLVDTLASPSAPAPVPASPSPRVPFVAPSPPAAARDSPPLRTPSPLEPLHIDEEGAGGAPHSGAPSLASRVSQSGSPAVAAAAAAQQSPFPAPETRRASQEAIVDVSPSVLASQLQSLVVLSETEAQRLTSVSPAPPAAIPGPAKKKEPRVVGESPGGRLESRPWVGGGGDPASVEPSLDEALDKLWDMSCALGAGAGEDRAEAAQEVVEERIVAVDRREVLPDTLHLREQGGKGEERVDHTAPHPETPAGGSPRSAEGKCTTPPQGEPEAVGTPGSPLDLPPLEPPAVERISASGQIKSVIKRTKETTNVHPMYREGQPRRMLGPVIFHKSSSQDRLIEELQGKLGIGRQERWRSRQDDWLTEGVIVMSKPARSREDGAEPEVDKALASPPVGRHAPHLASRPPPSPPASEKIMAQGKGGGVSPTGAPKPGNKLDNMLGSLQSDLNRLGVQTVAKGVCGACKKPIAGQVVTAMGRTWHPEHFVCTHCQEEIGSRNFFERDGLPYCEKDYHSLFSPRCYYCNGPILDKVVTALDRTWHPEHFFCAQCGSFFGPEGFHEKDGKAYCRKDYFDMFAPKCGGCARAILENYISALNALWHPECFVCRECFTPFVNGSFFEHDGQPYCEVHYHERRGSLCSGCQKPITGRCITAMGKKFHPEHFVCAFCLKQLNKGTFKEQNDKPYCQHCFVKLFS
ncbi:paxillin isoform X3 [Lepisosteus oculatus]